MVLAQYLLAVLVKLWSRDIIASWHYTGLLRAQYWLLLLAKYRQRGCANLWNSTGLVLAVNRSQILAINRHRSLIDSWHSTDLLLTQYWSLLLVKYRQMSYANLRHSIGLGLAVKRSQTLAINQHRNLNPGESIGKEFIPSQSELFRAISISVSKPIWIIPYQSKKLFVFRLMKNSKKSI